MSAPPPAARVAPTGRGCRRLSIGFTLRGGLRGGFLFGATRSLTLGFDGGLNLGRRGELLLCDAGVGALGPDGRAIADQRAISMSGCSSTAASSARATSHSPTST